MASLGVACRAGSVAESEVPRADAPRSGGPTLAASSAASAAPSLPAPELFVRMRPAPDEGAGGVLHVTVAITAPSEVSSRWRLPAALPAGLELHVSREQPGASGLAPLVERQVLHAGPGGLVEPGWANAAAPVVRVQLDYGVAAGDVRSALWSLDERRLVAQGRDVLVLPEGWVGSLASVLAIDASAYGSDGRAVSSLGNGPEKRAPLTRQALLGTMFAAGYLGSAVFDASEGHDEAAWFGVTTFDPRPLSAEVASFRTAVRERFNDRELRPLTLLLLVDRSVDTFEVTRAPVSVVARVSPGEPLTARLRLAILHQVMKEWVGAQLALRDSTGAEAHWFTEGMCRHLARELAFAFGLLTPAEYAEEVNGLMAMQAILLLPRYRSACAQGARVPDGAPLAGCANLVELVRGALHAAELDAALRREGHSLLALLEVLRSSERQPMALAAWAEALRRSGGARAVSLSEAFASGAPVLPQSEAFGPCFVRQRSRYAESLLGFEHAESNGVSPLQVTAVLPGPAFSAGIRPGMLLQRIDHWPHDAERRIRVVGTGGAAIEYVGGRRSEPGWAWRRVAGVRDDRCALQ